MDDCVHETVGGTFNQSNLDALSCGVLFVNTITTILCYQCAYNLTLAHTRRGVNSEIRLMQYLYSAFQSELCRQRAHRRILTKPKCTRQCKFDDRNKTLADFRSDTDDRSGNAKRKTEGVI